MRFGLKDTTTAHFFLPLSDILKRVQRLKLGSQARKLCPRSRRDEAAAAEATTLTRSPCPAPRSDQIYCPHQAGAVRFSVPLLAAPAPPVFSRGFTLSLVKDKCHFGGLRRGRLHKPAGPFSGRVWAPLRPTGPSTPGGQDVLSPSCSGDRGARGTAPAPGLGLKHGVRPVFRQERARRSAKQPAPAVSSSAGRVLRAGGVRRPPRPERLSFPTGWRYARPPRLVRLLGPSHSAIASRREASLR